MFCCFHTVEYTPIIALRQSQFIFADIAADNLRGGPQPIGYFVNGKLSLIEELLKLCSPKVLLRLLFRASPFWCGSLKPKLLCFFLAGIPGFVFQPLEEDFFIELL